MKYIFYVLVISLSMSSSLYLSITSSTLALVVLVLSSIIGLVLWIDYIIRDMNSGV